MVIVLKSEKELRENFQELLYDLSRDQMLPGNSDKVAEMINRLQGIYVKMENGKIFRHYYSDIFIVLSNIHNGISEGSIDVIGQNLQEIKKVYDPSDSEADISDSITKLLDHVSLECSRIGYTDARFNEASQKKVINDVEAKINVMQQELSASNEDMHCKVQEAQEKISNLLAEVRQANESQKKFKEELEQQKKDIEQQQKNVEKQKEKLEKQQREYIAILGIFASIVLAFTTGISFSTSVLENINTVSVYRMIIVVLIIGLVIVNALYGLFYYVDRLVVKDSDKKLEPLWIADAVLGGLLILTIVLWILGAVEKRDSWIANFTVSEKIEQEITIDNGNEEDRDNELVPADSEVQESEAEN